MVCRLVPLGVIIVLVFFSGIYIPRTKFAVLNLPSHKQKECPPKPKRLILHSFLVKRGMWSNSPYPVLLADLRSTHFKPISRKRRSCCRLARIPIRPTLYSSSELSMDQRAQRINISCLRPMIHRLLSGYSHRRIKGRKLICRAGPVHDRGVRGLLYEEFWRLHQ